MADTTLEDGDLWLPSEFPYEYGSVDSSPSSVLSSTVESQVSSTESESDGDEFLAGLSRPFSHSSLRPPQKIPHSQPNLEKPAVLFGSPESTLMAVRSWSVCSKGSPNAPFQFRVSPLVQNDNAWDLSYPAPPHGVLSIHPSQLVKNPTAAVACTHRCFSSTLPQPNHIKQVRVRQDQMEKQRSVNCGGFTQSPWPNLRIQHHNQPQNYNGFVPKAVFVGGSNNNNNDNGVKKGGCAGTGVFLPRTYVEPKESRKKPGLWTPPRARVSQPVQNKNFNAIAAHQARPCFNAGFIPHHDNLMDRGNAVLLRQKANLPQDWTY